MQTCRHADMQSVLRLLAEISEESHIPILLIGGHALQAYGVSRQTMDVHGLFADGGTATRMSGQATRWVVGETTCLVPALPHLVAMKLHAIRSNPQ